MLLLVSASFVEFHGAGGLVFLHQCFGHMIVDVLLLVVELVEVDLRL